MGINVSPKQIADRGLLNHAAALTRLAGVDIGNIVLEVTESLSTDYDRVSEWTRQCHDFGFRVALDDFGTGYSSLSHLHKFEIDTLKIDKSFVHEMSGNRRGKAIIENIVALAKSLDLGIVGEGVENHQQMTELCRLGCTYGQGYFLGRPQRIEAALKLL